MRVRYASRISVADDPPGTSVISDAGIEELLTEFLPGLLTRDRRAE
jgi:hypothetical protein